LLCLLEDCFAFFDWGFPCININIDKMFVIIFVGTEFMQYIQDDSGGKGSILGGGSIGHCEKKVYMNMCLIFEWLPR
jgi:hypothetical protein